MNSLRSRLILAFALVAFLPLVVTMALLGRRFQQAVDAQVVERLGAALGTIEAQLRAEGDRLSGRLEVMAGDPRLARLHAAAPDGSGELIEHVADQRFLLGLDYLGIVGEDRRIIADAAAASDSLPASASAPIALDAVPDARARGAAIVSLAGGRGLALDAHAPLRFGVARLRGGIALDSARLDGMARTAGVDLVLADGSGGAVAATILGGADVARRGSEGRVAFDGRSYIVRRTPLAIGPAPHPALVGFVSTAAADQTIGALWLTTALLALIGIAIAVGLAFAWSHQVSRPVERLAAFSERISRGEWDEPLALESVRELETLVDALERMRGDLRGYRERLRAGERQVAYGQMARAVAHEIKNPLTPIAVSVADLKRSFEQNRPDFPQILEQAVRTIGEEVHTLQRLIREFSDFGRWPAPDFARLEIGELFADLAALYAGETAAGRLMVEPPPAPTNLTGDRGQLRQALINLIQNAFDAAPQGRVTLRAAPRDETLEIEVADDGPGLPAERLARLFEPGFTTKAHGSGLGLTIVERIVTDHQGTVSAESAAGRGTTFTIRLPFPGGA